MRTFWEKGFAGTSMSDLVASTGMAKPGLYANFGDKEDIYKKALEHYSDKMASPLTNELLAFDGPLETALRRYLFEIAHSVIGNAHPKGCFIINSGFDCAEAGPGLKELSKSLNAARREALKTVLDRAQDRGELSKKADTNVLADFYSAQPAALASQAQAGAREEELRAMVEVALSALPGISKNGA
ncbi:TetR/AcrR family transcriptional regulator [uncultured Roseibium sp.]|uniref:TetR/AcrR family transcriptional regulator n=1 Tax=uncultured Roseibium sp. TaxID=1936171 RepID=UPI003217E50E